jgi:hypothetical protein
MVQQGVQAGTAMQVYSLLQEKIQKLRQMGQEAFDQGWSLFEKSLLSDHAGYYEATMRVEVPTLERNRS